MRRATLPAAAALAAALAAPTAAVPAAAADTPQVVKVVPLKAAPTVDGNLADWPKEAWGKIAIAPADDKVEHKAVGKIEVEFAAGVFGDRVFLAARWPDDKPDIDYRPWRWSGNAYKRTEDRDDMFAVRFKLDGDYDRCMISENTYAVDLWLWTAGRSNAAGLAEDMTHRITTALTDSAAEYKLPSGGTVYISKSRDGGDGGYETLRAGKQQTDDILPSIKLTGTASGSAADVAAKGVWADGTWRLELSRKLETGNPDDAALGGGRRVDGAIAVFNRSHSENKSVSGTLRFEFP